MRTRTLTELPLQLFEVLEEEYVSLHGPLDEENDVWLPGNLAGGERWRRVRARRDWRIHPGHIRNPLSLAFKLLPRAEQVRVSALPTGAGLAPDERQATLRRGDTPTEDVWRYMSAAIPANVVRDVMEHVPAVAHNLNALIDGPAPPLPSDDVTSGRATVPPQQRPTGAQIAAAGAAVAALEGALDNLLEDGSLYTARRFKSIPFDAPLAAMADTASDLSDADRMHFNRLLLEHLFPTELERVENVRLAAIYARLHERQTQALCLSGGGIRSGTFALGLLQGMARHGVLGDFDYLSTVSGGGYIGSWLTAWIQRDAGGLAAVSQHLANQPPQSSIDPDPAPVLHLRNYSNFITPKVGLLTADTWAFVAIYLRNLLLNWAVLIPLLVGCLLLPRLYVAMVLGRDAVTPLGVPLRYVLLVLGSILLIVAVMYAALNRPNLRETLRVRSPFWFKRADQRSFLVYFLLPIFFAAVVLTLYWAWSIDFHLDEVEAGKEPRGPAGFVIFGAAVPLLGWLLATLILRRYEHPREITSLSELAFVAFATIAGVAGGLAFWFTETRFETSPLVRDFTPYSWLSWGTELYAVGAVPVFLAGFLLAMTLFIGLTSHAREFGDDTREWWARANAWILIVIIGWAAFSGLVILGPLALIHAAYYVAPLGGLSGLGALLGARSAKTAASEERAAEKGAVASLLELGLPLIAMIFLATLAAALSLATSAAIAAFADSAAAPGASRFDLGSFFEGKTGPSAEGQPTAREFFHLWALHSPRLRFVAALVFATIGGGLILARLINLNKFSLHAGYRDRLIRAFLGASRRTVDRKPNPFTGFDPSDDIPMHELRTALLHESDFGRIGALAVKLREHTDAASRHLWDARLEGPTKSALSAYSADTVPSQSLKSALIEDLNRALQDLQRPLCKVSPFAELGAADPKNAGPVIDAFDRYPRSDYGILANRLVLQLAYPDEIQRKFPPPHRLFHVVNTALNLVGGDNLAWQQRRAEPFSVSALHCGCFRLGYRRAKDYGGQDGIRIGTAVAISGAAASSNMGYYTTSPVLSMVLTLFNVRLGWWLGNPGPAGVNTFRRGSPKWSVSPVLAEAFGLTDDTNKYVYLSDGGHFENLALYEMVLRRCKIIVVSDAGADENYELNDLGNAIRKIRIDLGIPIEFVDIPIWSNSLDSAQRTEEHARRGSYWSIGQIRYSCVDPGATDGVLIHIKPAVYGHEPQDVLHYKRSHKTFPNETTADQFFDEPQFESYRTLGSFVIDQMFAAAPKATNLPSLARALYRQGDGTGKQWSWPSIDAPWLRL